MSLCKIGAMGLSIASSGFWAHAPGKERVTGLFPAPEFLFIVPQAVGRMRDRDERMRYSDQEGDRDKREVQWVPLLGFLLP